MFGGLRVENDGGFGETGEKPHDCGVVVRDGVREVGRIDVGEVVRDGANGGRTKCG